MRLTLTGALLSAAWLAQQAGAPDAPPEITTPGGSAPIEQTAQGTQARPRSWWRASTASASASKARRAARPAAIRPTTASPSAPTTSCRPSTRGMAIFTKKGKQYDTTGKALYGPVIDQHVFKGFGGTCEARNNGDAVVRYDQLADRWLIVMPIFSRGAAVRPDQPPVWKPATPAHVSPPGQSRDSRARRAAVLPPPPPPPRRRQQPRPRRPAGRTRPRAPPGPQGPYSMCYAISTSARSARRLLPLRVPAAALPRLPASRGLAGRLLQPDEFSDNRISDTSPRRSTRASSIARRCSRASRRPSSASSSTT